MLFGFFAGNVHAAFLYPIMVYMWVSHPSPRQGEMEFVMYSYIRTAHQDLQRFMSQCKGPFTMKLDSAALTRAILTTNVRRLPGFIRLDPGISESTFESHWMFVVYCATEMLAQGEDEETVYSALAAIIKPYSAFPCQTKEELMPTFWVRLLQAYVDAHNVMVFTTALR